MVVFHCYVSLPKGTLYTRHPISQQWRHSIAPARLRHFALAHGAHLVLTSLKETVEGDGNGHTNARFFLQQGYRNKVVIKLIKLQA